MFGDFSTLIFSLQVIENGEEAIKYLQGQGKYNNRSLFPLPVLILLDLSLPGKNGFEILEWRKNQQKIRQIPIVVMAKSKNISDIIQAYNLGANAYLIKPITILSLQEKINELILPLERSIRILLIDNDEEGRRLTAEELRQEFPKIVIEEITEADQLVAALEIGNFDLVITELNGINWNGLDNLRLIKAHFPDCPVIILTSSANQEQLIEAMAAGVDDYVLKGPEPIRRRLSLTIRRALSRLWQHRALRESEERYRYISRTISDYAYAFKVKEDGTLQGEWVTDSFIRVFGFTRKEIDERGGWQTMVLPEDLPLALEHARKVAGGETDICEVRFVTREGEIRWLRDYATPVWDETKGKVIRIYGASQDITEKKRTERLLTALNQAQTFLAGCKRREEIFDGIKAVFQDLGFSCMLFPYDKETGRLFTQFLSFDSRALKAVENLVGLHHEDFSIK